MDADVLAQAIATLDTVTREGVEALAAAKGLSIEDYVASGLAVIARHRREASDLTRIADAAERTLVRLGLIPEPPPWPGFRQKGRPGRYVSEEGSYEVTLCRVDGDDWEVATDVGYSCYGLTPRGAIESLCASLFVGSPERAAVAAILARVP